MVDPSYVPDRGHVVWIDFQPQAGHEQSGRLPALVLSPEAYNRKTGLAILCPITGSVKGYPFETHIPDGCGVSGAVLDDHMKNLDWKARRAEFKCSLPSDVLDDVMAKLRALLF